MFPAPRPRRVAPCELRESCPSSAAYTSGSRRCDSRTGYREFRHESQEVRAAPEGLAAVRTWRLFSRALVHFSRGREMHLRRPEGARLSTRLGQMGGAMAAES